MDNEKRVTMSPEEFRNFACALPEPMYLLSGEGVILATNPAADRLLAVEKGALVGFRFHDLVAGGGVDLEQLLDGCLWDEGQAGIPLRLRALDGSITQSHCIASRVQPASADSPPLVMLQCNPEGAERPLCNTDAHLVETQHAAEVGSWCFDFVKDELSWSTETYRILEVVPEKFAATYEAFLERVHPEDREWVDKAYTDSVEHHTPYDIIHRLQLDDGRIKFVNEKCVTFYDARGEPLRSVGSVQDVTEQRTVEYALGALAGIETLADIQQFYRASITNLVEIYGAHLAFIGIFADPEQTRIQTQALWVDGGFVDNLEYELKGTPCADVLDRKVTLIPSGAIDKYPQDKLLAEMGIDSYFGAPLVNAGGEKVGLVAVLDTWPMAVSPWTAPVLGIFAQRITSAIEHARTDDEKRQAHEQMARLSSALEQTTDAISITNRKGVIEYVNKSFEEITGYSKREALGKRPNISKSGKQDGDFYKQLWKTILSGKPFYAEMVNRRKDGSLYYEEKIITPLKDEQGNITHFISAGRNVSERVETQEQLHYLAHHDILTELPNRSLLADRLEQALARAQRTNGIVAVMFLDLDHFKVINDSLGHDFGDQALKIVSERLQACVREGDTIARLGGDEFAIILDGIEYESDVTPIANKIMSVLSRPFEVNGRELYLTASIGVSFFPGDGDDFETLNKNADIAMFRAKEQGRNNCQFFSKEMGTRITQRLNMETSLRNAVERNEFLLHYQPQMDLAGGRLTGMEALLRWQRPGLGLVSPVNFIPSLEETGLIVPLGEWVLVTACKQAKAWQDAGGAPVSIAVNLSARQFQDAALVNRIESALQESGLEPGLLEVEITESSIMRDTRQTTKTFWRLKEMGVQIAIDDFGTGYSSLSYLKRFPIDVIKIDQSFIRDIATDAVDAAIVKTVIDMTWNLKLKSVAEGVETEAQLNFLKDKMCHTAQGSLISKSAPAEEITALIKASNIKAAPALRVVRETNSSPQG